MNEQSCNCKQQGCEEGREIEERIRQRLTQLELKIEATRIKLEKLMELVNGTLHQKS